MCVQYAIDFPVYAPTTRYARGRRCIIPLHIYCQTKTVFLVKGPAKLFLNCSCSKVGVFSASLRGLCQACHCERQLPNANRRLHILALPRPHKAGKLGRFLLFKAYCTLCFLRLCFHVLVFVFSCFLETRSKKKLLKRETYYLKFFTFNIL